jgi:dTDP-4-amino-4,6-dideoxygalactose transaminase
MNINWLNSKDIDHDLIKSYLEESEQKNHFTNYGPLVRKLEEKSRTWFDISDDKAVIAVNNASAGLHALASGINKCMGKTLRYATQSYTFPPSAQGSLKDSIIVDIDDEIGLDLSLVPLHLVDGIIVTNIFGNLTNLQKYVDWAKEHNKILLFDNAATALSNFQGKNASNFGHGAVISFHHTKPLGFGEGGLVIVDRKYEECVRQCINFGIDNNLPFHESYWHREGSNYKMSDLAAAYILQFLNRKLVDIKQKHLKLYQMMKEKIAVLNGVHLMSNLSDGTPFVTCFCLIFDDAEKSQEQRFLDQGIYCRKYYKPLVILPKSKWVYEHVLCLPCHSDMTLDDINLIVDLVKQVLGVEST